MKPAEELPALLWPFRASELYGVALNGPCFAFAEPRLPNIELALVDVRELKLELAEALKTVRGARVSPDNRKAAAARVTLLRGKLIQLHLRLRRMSIGYRASPSAPVCLWP